MRALVVPRTMESSMSTTRLPATTPEMGLSLIRTLSSRLFCPGAMKVRPIYLFLMKPIS